MGTKPTQDPKWVTTDDPNEIIEPSPALKTNGVQSGGIWGREHLNWMFNAISKWIDYVRSFVLDKDNNLSELTNKSTARNNLSVYSKTETDDKYPQRSNNLSDVDSVSIAFNNIKQNATTTSTGVVEKATVTEMSNGTTDKFPDCNTVKDYAVANDNVDGNYPPVGNVTHIPTLGSVNTLRLGRLWGQVFTPNSTTTSLNRTATSEETDAIRFIEVSYEWDGRFNTTVIPFIPNAGFSSFNNYEFPLIANHNPNSIYLRIDETSSTSFDISLRVVGSGALAGYVANDRQITYVSAYI